MAIWDWIRSKRKELKLEDVRREEIKFNVRESQALAKLEKIEKEREDIFAKGSKAKSPMRRRQFARLYDQKSQGIRMQEQELAILSKELTTLSALRLTLERRQMAKEGIQKMLNRVSEVELVTLLEDDKVTTEMYVEKLNGVLSTLNEGATEVLADLGREGSEVMNIWQKMDDGEIDSFDAGIKLADKAVRSKMKDAEAETE